MIMSTRDYGGSRVFVEKNMKRDGVVGKLVPMGSILPYCRRHG